MQVDNNYRWENCPLCNSSEISAVGEIDYRMPVMFSTIAVELKKTPELYKCDVCESWFTQNIISEKTALEMYSQGESSNKWPRKVGFAEEKSTNIIHRLEQYFNEGVKTLDIGCNTGTLLDFARSKGCITTGVEPSLLSQEILNKKGHATFSSIESVEGTYDVITAFDLVEHIHDLSCFFNNISNLLVSGGVVLLLTGDKRSLGARLSKNNWWYLKAPEHIVFPSKIFLTNIKGLELVSIDETFASKGYDRPLLSLIQFIRKYLIFGGYEGLPPLRPDHMLVTLKG